MYSIIGIYLLVLRIWDIYSWEFSFVFTITRQVTSMRYLIINLKIKLIDKLSILFCKSKVILNDAITTKIIIIVYKVSIYFCKQNKPTDI